MTRVDVAVPNVVVVGLGQSGRAAARLALLQGASVVAVDRSEACPDVPGARMELGAHRLTTFLEADTIVVSPGVPAALPELVAARAAGVDVVGELGFAWRTRRCPCIAVTGTNGKSTVTHFVGQLLTRALGPGVFVGGNLGTPLSSTDQPPVAAVVEVSSYQLELPGTFDPQVGVILNLTEDHLARHGTLEAYGRTKARLFERMGPLGWGLLPASDPQLAALAEGVGAGRRLWMGRLPGWVREGRAVRVQLDGPELRLSLEGFEPPGEHNLDHAATAVTLALAFGIAPEVLQAGIRSLTSLPHRMQVVHDAGGVRWIDDSKATNVESTRVGVGGLDRPAVVLLGGQAKGESLAPLAPLLGRHRAVLCFGGSGAAMAVELEALGVAVERVGSLEDAIVRARALAQPGDAVLLSPAAASFDAFRNFEHRGQTFARLAQEGSR